MNAIQQDNANTANTLVRRDASGNFSAGTITATLSGNASTATAAAGSSFFTQSTASEGQIGALFTGQNSVYIYNNASAWGIYSASGGSAFQYTRSSGLFNFNGNASTATTLQTTRTIWGQNFNGSANVTGALSGATTITASSDISLGGELNFTTAGAKYVDFYTDNDAGALSAVNFRLVNNASTSFHQAIQMTRGGAVELYHNNSLRLNTAADGIRIIQSTGYWTGFAPQNNYVSASLEGGCYIDFRNESGVPKSSVHGIFFTNGGSELRFYTTASGVVRGTDTRTLGFTLQSDGITNFNQQINVPQNNNATGGGINFNSAGSAFIRGRNQDGASNTLSNLQLQSWFGIGFGPSISGQTVPQGENAFWINVRDGSWASRGSGSATTFVSTVATGTAPLTVASTTVVTNLNADFVDGKQVGTSGNTIPLLDGANTWSGVQTFNAIPAFNGGTSGTSAPFTVDSTFLVTNLNADLLDGVQGGSYLRSDAADTVSGVLTFSAIPAFNGGTTGSTAPFTVDSTFLVTNLNADLLDGLNSATANTASTIVARDASGNFSAGTITATLSGNASTATTLATTRTIWGQNFNGSANVTGALSGATTISASSTITGTQLISTVATGTAPLTVSSTTLVTNLNADLVDGKQVGTSGNTIPLLDGTNTWSGVQTFNAIPAFNGGTTGTSAPFTVDSTFLVTNLNADLLDGKNTGTSGNTIPLLDGANTWSAIQLFSDVRSTVYYQRNDTNSYWNTNELVLRNSAPTVVLRDTDSNSAFLHCNSSIFYVLRGNNDTGYGGWSQVGGAWPAEINLTNNDAFFGRDLYGNSSVRAPIFYDRNDTFYFCDPASGSRFRGDNALEVVGTNATVDVWGGCIEVREVNYAATSVGGNDAWAPGITFHWGGVAASAIKMFADASIRFVRQGGGLQDVRMDSLWAIGVWNNTTGGGANVNVNSNGRVQRSTSSIKWKKDVETLEDSYVDNILDNVRPVWYRSKCEGDNPNYGFYGVIAEEVVEIDPRLVELGPDNQPEGVYYTQFIPHLLNIAKRQKQKIEDQQSMIEDLLIRVAALENK
jgi:hypothetical protein